MMTALGRRAGSHKSPPRCEKNLKEQQAVRCCGDAALSPETPAIPQAENQPSVVQVIEPKSCEKLENVLGFYHGNTDRCGASQMDGKCHKAATFKEATATCSAVGARLCSAEELVKDVARSSGCNLDTSMVWTSTPGNCGPNSWMVSRGSSLGFIASRHLKCFESDLLTRKRGVRCCAEVAAPSFRARRSVPASVSVPLDDTAQQLGSVLPFVAGVAVLAMAAVLAVQQFASRTATVRTIEIPNNSHYQHTLVTVTAI